MRLQAPFETVTPTVDGDVLAALGRTVVPLTVGDLARRIPSRSSQGIRVAVQRLAVQGVVTADRVGRTFVWSLNREHLAAEALVALASMRQALLDRLVDEVAVLTELRFAALFGSAARGTMRVDSDIDLFLVHSDAARRSEVTAEVTALEWKVSAWTGNDARSLLMSESEVNGDVPVLRQIADEGITLTGDPMWLHRRMSKRAHEQARSV